MTGKDGNTALAALILVLACLARAHGVVTVDLSRNLSRARAEREGQAAASDEPAVSSGATTLVVREEPEWHSEVAAVFWRSAPSDEVTRLDGLPDIVPSRRRISSEFSGDDEDSISFPADDFDRLEAPEPPLLPGEQPDAPEALGFFEPGYSAHRSWLALRLGWWKVDAVGDLTKVGEYQDLDSLPFYDADVLHSDGVRTIDVFASGLDNSAGRANLNYFGPLLRADLDYQRYLHRLDHDPLTNMGNLASGELVISEDLNAGEDYAIRVQDLKTSFRGKLTKNIKLGLNFRVLRKEGDRQANAVRHCYPGVPQDFGAALDNHCHVFSRGQRIDWVTVKFEPVVEAKFGPVRAEYSRPMRVFNQNDQVVMQPFGIHNLTDQPYALVPENFTQVDRLKLGVDLGADTRFYARGQTGDTHNKLRETHRDFHGFDLRLTNESCDGLTLTGYATLNEQRNQDPPFFLPEEAAALAVPTSIIPPYGIRHPIDFFRRSVGAEASWRPSWSDPFFKGLSLTAGAEQGLIERNFAQYVVQEPESPPGPVVDQERTAVTSFHAGASRRWLPSLETYVRYKLRVTKDPLFAVNRYYGYTNTRTPEEEHLVEVGGTWMLGSNFLATASVGLENRQHDSEVAYFQEDDYPMTFTLWYAPTPKWSLSAGYGFYSNWIDQDITFPSDTPAVSVGDTRRWSYGGLGRVVSVGGRYAWTRRLSLSGGVEYVWARDAIDPLAPWPDLDENFDVVVDRARVTGGVDWRLGEAISAYFRYRFEDYEDASVAFNSGTAHMFLAGLSAVY
ncbi:MAG: hypothetical protein ABIK89_17510 [Planctomycetota bacterium]